MMPAVKLVLCMLGAVFLPLMQQVATAVGTTCATSAADVLIKQRGLIVFQVAADVDTPVQVTITWEADGVKQSHVLEIPGGRTITYSKEFPRQVAGLRVVVSTRRLQRKYALKLNLAYQIAVSRAEISARALPKSSKRLMAH